MVPAIFDVHGAYLYSADCRASVRGQLRKCNLSPVFHTFRADLSGSYLHGLPLAFRRILPSCEWEDPELGKDAVLLCPMALGIRGNNNRPPRLDRWFLGRISRDTKGYRFGRATARQGSHALRVLVRNLGLDSAATWPCRHCKWVLYLRHLQCRSL